MYHNLKFSILVPVYNAEKFLERSISSALNQTYSNYEIILVDDGSTDNSGEVCDRYAQQYPDKIKVAHKRNMGQLHTRCKAMTMACGDVYVFLDADDRLKQNALEIITYKIKKYDPDCVIFGWEYWMDGKLVSVCKEETEQCITEKRALYRKCFFNPQYNSMCRKAIKATVFDGRDYERFYYLRHAEDLIQSVEVLQNSQKVLFIKESLYEYISNPVSITHSNRLSIDFLYVRAYLLAYLKKANVFLEEDFEDYYQFCLKLLATNVYEACVTLKTISALVSYFDCIKTTELYRDVLCYRKHKKFSYNVYLWQFRHGFYNCIRYESIAFYHGKKMLHHLIG